MPRITREKLIKKDKWITLETHWSSVKVNFYFRRPRGARIRVRYGFGWFSRNRQKQTLDGSTEKTISIGFWGVTRSKIQINNSVEALVVYGVEPIGP